MVFSLAVQIRHTVILLTENLLKIPVAVQLVIYKTSRDYEQWSQPLEDLEEETSGPRNTKSVYISGIANGTSGLKSPAPSLLGHAPVKFLRCFLLFVSNANHGIPTRQWTYIFRARIYKNKSYGFVIFKIACKSEQIVHRLRIRDLFSSYFIILVTSL